MHWHESNFVIKFNLFSESNCNNLPKLKFVRALKRIEGGCLMFCACLTGWPDWAKFHNFWLLIKGKIWFVECILRVQKDFLRMFWTLKLNFNEDILEYFCFSNCFGYFFKILGKFFQIFWSPWCLTIAARPRLWK